MATCAPRAAALRANLASAKPTRTRFFTGLRPQRRSLSVLNGRRSGRGFVCRCPNTRAHAHGDRSPSSVYLRRAQRRVCLSLFQPALQSPRRFEALRSRGLVSEAPRREAHPPVPAAAGPTAPDYDAAKRQRLARAIWREGRHPRRHPRRSLSDRPGSAALRRVGRTRPRFHPALWLDENRPSVPGLIAAFRPIIGDLHPESPPAAIHRVFLNPDGSAIRDEHGKRIKRMLGPSKGCAIKLTADEEVASGLGIVEGIEDGLGRLATGWAPIWALGSTEGIKQLPVLSGIECLTIFADHDAKGQG